MKNSYAIRRGAAWLASMSVGLVLVLGSVQAGHGIKPCKGWTYQTLREPVDPMSVPTDPNFQDPFFEAVIAERGLPNLAMSIEGGMFSNGTGRSTHAFGEIGYWNFDADGNFVSSTVFAKGVFTAANGDELQEYHFVEAWYEDGVIIYSYDLCFDGGTGRFEGASGHVTGIGSELDGFRSEFEGWITTVGSTMRGGK